MATQVRALKRDTISSSTVTEAPAGPAAIGARSGRAGSASLGDKGVSSTTACSGSISTEMVSVTSFLSDFSGTSRLERSKPKVLSSDSARGKGTGVGAAKAAAARS